MKKILFLLALCFILFPVNAFAGEALQNETNGVYIPAFDECFSDTGFKIINGIKYFDKAESTFDSSRTVSGTAEENTLIEIEVSVKSASGKLTQTGSYSMLTGASELFCQEIELNIGENVISVKGTSENGEIYEKSVTIKRKKAELKLKLESAIIISDNALNISDNYFLAN